MQQSRRDVQSALVCKLRHGLLDASRHVTKQDQWTAQHPSTHVSLKIDIAAAMASARSPPGVPSMGLGPRVSTHSNE
jgi:hypothetical protein